MDLSEYYDHDPFATTSEAAVQFLSRSQKNAFQAIIDGVEGRKGFVAILGEHGMGKTATLHVSLKRFSQQEHLRILSFSSAYLPFPALLEKVCEPFEIPCNSYDIHRTLDDLHEVLTQEEKQGRNVVLILDDADKTPIQTLEHLPLFTDRETATGKLIQIVFLGQLTLDRKLKLPQLQPLKKQIAIRSLISPLTTQESLNYVQYRLAQGVKREDPLFTPAALKRVVKYARGNPRMLDKLCSQALASGMRHDHIPIPHSSVQEALTDCGSKTRSPLLLWGPACLVVALLVTALFVGVLPSIRPQQGAAVSQAEPPPVSSAQKAVRSELRELQQAVPAVRPTTDPTQDAPHPEKQASRQAESPMEPTANRAQDVVHLLEEGEAVFQASLSVPSAQEEAHPEGQGPLRDPERTGVLQEAQVPSVAVTVEPPPRRELESPIDSEPQQGRASAEEVDLSDTRVVCVRPRPTGDRGKDIVLMDYAGSDVQQLIADGALNLVPILSPDGTTLAYTSYRSGKPTIYLRDLKTTREERLTSRSGMALPNSWSPDGRYLALSQSLDGNSEIFLYDTTRKRLRRLTTHGGIDISPSFAPDSTRLVFTSNRGGASQIYLTDVDRSSPIRLTSEGSYNTSAVWSPRDETIAFVGRSEDETLSLYTIRADGTKRQRLISGRIANEQPTWAPDGRFVMYTSMHDGVQERRLVRVDGQEDRALPGQGHVCHSPQWVARHAP